LGNRDVCAPLLNLIKINRPPGQNPERAFIFEVNILGFLAFLLSFVRDEVEISGTLD